MRRPFSRYRLLGDGTGTHCVCVCVYVRTYFIYEMHSALFIAT